MKTITTLVSLLAALPLAAQLPMCPEINDPGTFAQYSNHKSRLRVDTSGKIFLQGQTDRRNFDRDFIKLKAYVQTRQSDGRWSTKKTNYESLKSTGANGLNPKKPIVFTTRATGGIVLQQQLQQQRDGIIFNAKLLETGDTPVDQIRLVVELDFPNLYSHLKSGLDAKSLKATLKNSRLRFTPPQGKALKTAYHEPLPSPASSGSPLQIRALELRTDRLGRARTFSLTSKDLKQQPITLRAKDPTLTYKGFIGSFTFSGKDALKATQGFKVLLK